MKKPHALQTVLVAAAALLALSLAPKDNLAADVKTKFTPTFEPATARTGEYGVLKVEAKIPEGWHLYSMTKIDGGPKELKFLVDSPEVAQEGEWRGPKPKIEHDENFKKDVEYFEGIVSHAVALKIIGKDAGEYPIDIKVKGQLCKEGSCLMIRDTVSFNLIVEQGEIRADHSSPPKIEGRVKAQMGIIAFFLVALGAGLVALLTPCVFPMIPITISFFSKFAKVSFRRALTMATIYAGSIILTFTAIGVIISIIFEGVGMQAMATSPWFNLFLTGLLIFFAFNLWGLFEIQMPAWLISRTSQKEHALTSDEGSLRHQASGVFFMALTFTLVSFTCTVGFIGGLMAAAAQGDVLYPTIGMFGFSLTFSLPFFLLALFPSAADKLRGRGGDWMVAVKVVLGFIEFAGAFKFLSNVDLVWKWEFVSRPLVLAIWVAIFFAAGLFLLRVFHLPHSDTDTKTIGPIRMFFALAMIAMSAYAATGIRDTKSMGGWLDGWLPPSDYLVDDDDDRSKLPWIKDDIEGAIEQAKKDNKALFIDFTGYTCTNCRYMEESVFPKAAVNSRLEKMVLAKVFTDGDDKKSEDQQDYQLKRFNTLTLPYYVIIDPHNDKVIDAFESSTNEPQEFVDFLQRGLDAWEKIRPQTKPQASGARAHDTQKSAGGAESDELAGVSVDLAATGQSVDLEFPGLFDKKPFKLSSLRGQWVFVNFWASWCSPCVKEIRHDFPAVFDGSERATLLTLAFDEMEDIEAPREIAKETVLHKFPALHAGTSDFDEVELDDGFGVENPQLPISYLIHPDGHVAWKRVGSVDTPLLRRLFAQIPSE